MNIGNMPEKFTDIIFDIIERKENLQEFEELLEKVGLSKEDQDRRINKILDRIRENYERDRN